ncbi:hypothetical protein EVAR_95059_1 [Eumeta japonica]|uniref:Uncharacterized protein n=1 Tax=Eumeta variegata TaxID=151549 RepID=A0A4C1W8Z4_EUMVA|nr:hypothetical protein EVAR_95059_1 [Eumeta japonica]
MEWRTKENSPIHPASDKNIDVRPPEPAKTEARPYWGKCEGAVAVNRLQGGQPLSNEATHHPNTSSTCVKVVVKEDNVHVLIDSEADVYFILGTDFIRQNAVVLDYKENKIVFSKKGLHASPVSHMSARTEQKLSSAVIYFEDWVDKNEKYVSVCNLALISMPEKQCKLDANGEALGASLMQEEKEMKEMHPKSTWKTLIEKQRGGEFSRHTVETLIRNGVAQPEKRTVGTIEDLAMLAEIHRVHEERFTRIQCKI